MTNYGRLKTMEKTELAYWFALSIGNGCYGNPCCVAMKTNNDTRYSCKGAKSNDSCADCWLEWLSMKAKR